MENKAPFGGGIELMTIFFLTTVFIPREHLRRFFLTYNDKNNGTITGNHAVLTHHKANNDPYAEKLLQGGGIYVASQEVTKGANITNNNAGSYGVAGCRTIGQRRPTGDWKYSHKAW